MTTAGNVTASEDRTVELYVRELAPRAGRERVDRARTELARLADEGEVDDYTITIWGDALPVDGDHALVDRVAAFREWAAETDATLVGVERRQTGTLVDDLVPVWTLPALALAEYRDGELVHVTPHERDGAVHTVDDRLGALVDEATETAEPERVAAE